MAKNSTYNLTKRAVKANERRAAHHLNELEQLAEEAKRDGNKRLATDIHLHLYEHAVGKPKERREVQTINKVSFTLKIVPPALDADWRSQTLPESSVPLLGEAPKQPDAPPTKQDIVKSLSEAFQLAGDPDPSRCEE